VLLERDGLLERGREHEEALPAALVPLAVRDLVSEVRGGVGTMAAVELTAEARNRHPRAVFSVMEGARKARSSCARGYGGRSVGDADG
jgi:adenosylmethionine-8-amino-7-oxononanoate aminotransferase